MMNNSEQAAWVLLSGYYYAEPPKRVQEMPEMKGVAAMIDHWKGGCTDYDALVAYGERELGNTVMAQHIASRLIP